MKAVHQFCLDEPAGADPNAPRMAAVGDGELNAWLDGELPVAVHRALELRVATEAAGRARVHELNQIRTLVLRAPMKRC